MSHIRLLGMGSLALVAIVVAAYAGVFWNDFVEYDDNIYITINPHTRAGLTENSIRYALTTFETGNWIPLTWLSLQLDATVLGVHPWVFHGKNLALHAINVVLLFLWLQRVTGAHWPSLTVALLFGIHPLHVESVAWASERKDVLSLFWLMVSLLAYERHALRLSLGWYLLLCIAFALGLLSKTMVVTLPVLLLFADVWLLNRRIGPDGVEVKGSRYPQRTGRELLREKGPLLVLSAVASVMQMIAASHSTVFSETAGLHMTARLGNAVRSYGWYLVKTIWPTNLSVMYPHPLNDVSWLEVAMSGLLLVAITGYVAWYGRRRPQLWFGWMWYLVSLLPVIGLVQVGAQAHADRYSYMPHIGLLMAVVGEGHYLLGRFSMGATWGRIVVATCVTSGFLLTTMQVSVWRTTETLWEHAISVNPENWYAHMALGYLRLDQGDVEAGRRHFAVVLKHRSNNKAPLEHLLNLYERHSGPNGDEFRLQYEVGEYYYSFKSFEQSRTRFERALVLKPNDVDARFGLGTSLVSLGRLREARAALEFVVDHQPFHAQAQLKLGVICDQEGDIKSALHYYAAAAQLDPSNTEARDRKHDALQRLTGR